jgi:hypothetical protein
MNFANEINQIKKDRNQNINVEKNKTRQEIKNNFAFWIQETIDDIENVKEGIKSDVLQGKNASVVMSKVLRIHPLDFDGLPLRVLSGNPPDTTIMKKSKLHREYDNQYECVKSSLLPSKLDWKGLNGRLHYIDKTVGKRVILDDKLIELWELLESMGLRPFFHTYHGTADLCVRL